MKAMLNTVSATTCKCGNAKKASKLICTSCSFIQYIRGTKDTIPTKTCACGNSKQAGVLSCAVCEKALRWYLDRRAKYEGFNQARFIKYINKDHGIGIAGKCSLCYGNYIFGGNNPQPVIDDYDARCCDKCNFEIILPTRFNEFARLHTGKVKAH